MAASLPTTTEEEEVETEQDKAAIVSPFPSVAAAAEAAAAATGLAADLVWTLDSVRRTVVFFLQISLDNQFPTLHVTGDAPFFGLGKNW